MKNLKLFVWVLLALPFASCQDTSVSADQVQVQTRTPAQPVLAKKQDNPLMEIRLEVADTTQSYTLTGIEIDLEGTTKLVDLQELRLVYLPDPESQDTVQFGQVTDISSTVLVEGSQELASGTHQFLLLGSLRGIPELTNRIAAQVTSLKFNERSLTLEPKQDPQSQRIGVALKQKNEDDVHSYRIPGLATTNEGTLIAVYDNRYEHSGDLQAHVDVGMSRSTDGGQTWEDMEVIMDMGEYGGRPQDENGIGDPAVLVDRNNNTIWVSALWLSANKDQRAWTASQPGMDPEETGQFVLVKSEDDGLTWSKPINITMQIKKPEWRLFFNGPGNGITMKDGTLVFAAQYRDKEGMPHSTIVYSKDQGKTWEVGTGAKPNTTEAQVVELQDGSLMLNMRDNRNNENNPAHDGKHGRSVAITKDLGQTWEEHPTSREALPESTVMASIIAADLENHGRVLFFSNPNSTTDRSKMTIKASLDEGMTWKEDHQLLLYESGGFGYSCLSMVDEDHVGILYEGARDLYFEKIPVSEILGQQGE